MSRSQGLFTNGGFESFTSCPTALSQGNKAVGVTNCTVTADYYNTCGFSTSSCGNAVPLLPANGNGCLGMFCQPWSAIETNYETAVLTLDNPTVNGTLYNVTFSLYNRDINFNSCTVSGAPIDCFSFGLYFFKSTSPIGCVIDGQPAPNVFIGASQTAPLNTWHTFNLSYTANDIYDRALFGWFPNALAYNTAACPSNKNEYVYIDNLCIDVPGGNCAINPCNYSVNAGLNAVICASDSITLSGTVGGGVINNTWTTSGDGTFNDSTLLNATYIPGLADITAGTVTLTITTDNPAGACNAESSNIILTITNVANASISAILPFCESDNATNLSAVENGGIWSGNGIINATSGLYSPSAAGAGTWTINYTINGQCGDEDTISITVTSSDTALISYPQTTYCLGASNPTPNILATTGGTFTINNGGVINSNSGVLDLTASGIGNYTVTYYTSGICSDTTTFLLNISSNTNASITPIGPLCETDSAINLSSSETGGTWSGNGITDTSLGSFSPIIVGQGTWPIIYTISGQCGDADTISIVVEPIVDATISPVGPFCDKDAPINLTAQNIGGIWSGSGIVEQTIGTFDPAIANSGVWNITYTILGTCNNIGNTSITVTKTDNAQFNYTDWSFCIPYSLDPSPVITGTMGGKFTIDHNGIINDTNGTIDLKASGIGNYVVTYSTSDVSLCPNSSSVSIEICGETSIFIPNVFTPNGDNSNDVFNIKGENILSIDAKIFNRWGQLIYSWNAVKGFWDGRTTSGIEAADGTYYYLIKIIDLNNDEYVKHGIVTLLR